MGRSLRYVSWVEAIVSMYFSGSVILRTSNLPQYVEWGMLGIGIENFYFIFLSIRHLYLH